MSAHAQSASTSSASSSNTAVHHVKTLVLCFDGTGNSYSEKNTNVVKFFRMLDKSRPDEQMVYYEPGVGTYISPGAVSPLFENVAKTVDFMVAWDINQHITDGYRFLMRNYRDGDKICLMGFSRGAYTARALAGMLSEVGLLPRDNDQLVPFAYQLYETESDLADGFKLTYSRDVNIDFVGVWDTVSSVGVLLKRELPFTKLKDHIRVFRHAMSLDERRARFQPNPWHMSRDAARKPSLLVPPLKKSHKCHGPWERERCLTKLESAKAFSQTDVLEVWFAGSHTDVGGGSTFDGSENPLSDIPLWWMIRQLIKSGCPVRFADSHCEPMELRVVNDAMKEFDARCAKATLLDVLSMPKYWYWWILEFLPASKYWEDDKGGHSTCFLNFGRGRKIYQAKPIFHSSVKKRMLQLGYKPCASWKKGSEEYRD